MNRQFEYLVVIVFLIFTFGCGGSKGDKTQDEGTVNQGEVLEDITFSQTEAKVPTLVIIMNWTNYSEEEPLIWYDKIFNHTKNSVNRWFYDSTDAYVELVPITENSGTYNDGIISVSMGKAHPGGSNDTSFRDIEIYNAITSASVDESVDFKNFDTNGDGEISRKELQVLFIVAGGEESYGGSTSNSIWAHSWSFDSDNAPTIDGVSLMRTTGDNTTSGNYARFGSIHDINGQDPHKATVGIIAHEIGHSLFNLIDLYNTTPGHSGLGYYDVMSGGSWGQKSIDDYPGDTPTQFSAYSKIDTGIDLNVSSFNVSNSSGEVTIGCGVNEYIKLETTQTNEYFLLECRDSARVDSDRTFNNLDSSFTVNRLFALLYHVDTNKANNGDIGVQTATNHYRVAVVERDTAQSLTTNSNITANFSDTYIEGHLIEATKTATYAGTSGYGISVVSADYTQRTMTFQISK